MSATPLPVRRILRVLGEKFPDAVTALNHENPLQLLIATILSAQCTDVRINIITPALFAKYPDAASFATADRKELEAALASVNFFRNKAKNVQLACRAIVERYNGQVPDTLDELVTLPGVGRKTANVVLGDAFATPGVTVDTHVGRLSRRMGLTGETNPVKVERDLMKIVPRKQWTQFSHGLILHGRSICKARKPLCEECPFLGACPRIGVVEPPSPSSQLEKKS